MRRIRVVFALDSLGVGGTEMNAVRVAEGLDPARFDLSFACFDDTGALSGRVRAGGFPIDVFPVGSLQGPGFFTQGRRFRRYLRDHAVDVVHAHDRYANIFAVPWARLARTPAIIASKRWGSISARHGVGNRLAYRLAHLVLANSRAVGASLSVEDGVGSERVVVVPNFVDDVAFEPPPEAWRTDLRRELSLADDALVVGIVANLRAIKDHATLLHAIAALRSRFPALVLVAVGAGDQRAPLEQLAASLGIADVVRFAGSRPNRPNLNFLFDLSVLTSISEGFPNSLVEAMAASRAVVATSVGGVADAVTHGETGLLVPPRDPAQLAEAMASLLGDRAARARMGAAGLAKAQRDFGAPQVLHNIEALYERMLTPRVA
ncbi:MAG: glycosyltransferase [Gemmatimonadaceae bacterium]